MTYYDINKMIKHDTEWYKQDDLLCRILNTTQNDINKMTYYDIKHDTEWYKQDDLLNTTQNDINKMTY